MNSRIRIFKLATFLLIWLYLPAPVALTIRKRIKSAGTMGNGTESISEDASAGEGEILTVFHAGSLSIPF